MTASLVALGDQVQQTVIDSGAPVVGFILVTDDGQAEYRSPLPLPQLRAMLAAAVDAL